MKHKRSTTQTRTGEHAGAIAPDIRKQLRIVAVVSVLVASAVSVFAMWDHLFPVPPNELVTIYRVHGCSCVFRWEKALETAGFTVKIVELSSLKSVRIANRVPKNLNGCHVATYLDYFVEGHVAPQALTKLASEHPAASGVVTAAAIEAAFHGTRPPDDEHSPVYKVAADAKLQPWFIPQ